MHHGPRPISFECIVERCGLQNVACNKRPPANIVGITSRQVVENNRGESMFGHCLTGMTAYEAGAAGDENRDFLLAHPYPCQFCVMMKPRFGSCRLTPQV